MYNKVIPNPPKTKMLVVSSPGNLKLWVSNKTDSIENITKIEVNPTNALTFFCLCVFPQEPGSTKPRIITPV